jgi:hypothetical protein
MLATCTCPVFLDSYESAGFWTFLQVSALASYWLKDMQIVRQRQKKMTNAAPTIFSAGKAASKSTLSIHNYTPLVISGNGKKISCKHY